MIGWLADVTYKTGRRIVIGLVGGTVLVIGLALLVLPGPAFVVIPIGLAILGIEFAWARRFLTTLQDRGGDALERVGLRKRKQKPKEPSPPEGDDGSPSGTRGVEAP